MSNNHPLTTSKFSKPRIEQALLGLAYIQDSTSSKILPYLTREDFTVREYADFFDVLYELFMSASSINHEQVLLLAQKKNYKFINFEFLSSMEMNAGLTSNIANNLKELVRLTKLRTLEQKLNRIQNEISTNVEVDENIIVNEIQDLILELDKSSAQSSFITSKQASDELMKDIDQRRMLDPNTIRGITTGFKDIDTNTQGFQPGEFIIIAARPAMGKTAFALNIANNAAKNNKKVVFFTLEMTAISLMTRLYGINTEIDLNKFKKVQDLSETDLLKIGATRESYINKLNLLIDESADNDINNIIWKCRRLQKVQGLDLIIIDYLQLLSSSISNRDNRQNEIAKVSRALKTLALELKIPIIALSQLSREVEKRENKRPILSDIRESGGIEQDADIVMFLYRKNYYKKKGEVVENKMEYGDIGEITDVIIAKHRNGPTDDYQLLFRMNCGKFMDTVWKMDDNLNTKIKTSEEGDD
ncbi:replicative DNA helicase [Mycoplasmopsis adleri]|uniref:replicative DNA helicase n=1 Tax=Mycoplasmopsis adleri TaxID=51362 RepID=UPI0038735233